MDHIDIQCRIVGGTLGIKGVEMWGNYICSIFDILRFKFVKYCVILTVLFFLEITHCDAG